MVHTPWSEEPIPLAEAAETGTRKVICEHSTIGILVTTDGSIGDIPRESYVEAEERVARELSMQNKPFAIILNSAHPEREEATALAYELERKYNAPVALVNCRMLDSRDACEIFELLLSEFRTVLSEAFMSTNCIPGAHLLSAGTLEIVTVSALKLVSLWNERMVSYR